MSFFADFFGKTQQKDLATANAQAQGNINQYGDKSRGAVQQGSDEASGFYKPWAQQGQQGQTAYNNSLGLNGQAGGQAAHDAYGYGANPHLKYEQDEAQRAIEASNNARGDLGGGNNAFAVAKARMGLGYQDYQNWQNRLQGVGAQGFQASGAQAGIAQQRGQYFGDSYSGQGQQLAGNNIQYGNALAQSRSTGINNLMNVGALGVRAAAAVATGGTSEIAGAAAAAGRK